MSHSYPSDISREQFVRILPTLESARRRTKPRTVYDVFCGVLYLLKSGCQWRMLPADFPNWRTCYKYFRQWSERPGPGQDSIPSPKKNRLARPDKAMDGKSRPAAVSCHGFARPPYSQSVKNTDTAGHKGYDAGKKVSGIKRHIAVDTQGLPHAIHVTTADVNRLAMFDRRRDGLSPERVRGLHRTLCHCGARPVGSRGGSGETQRTHTFVVPGWWTVACLKELRKEAACKGGALRFLGKQALRESERPA